MIGVYGLHHGERFADFGQGVGEEILAAKTGFDGHDEDAPDAVWE